MPEIDIDKILKGSIDMHVHHGPTSGPARYDAAELAVQAQQAGMGGIVLKDSGYMNAPIATMINKRLQGTIAYGSLCLNHHCGGLNYQAVDSAGRLGARVIWMPTYSAENSLKKYRQMGIPFEGEGISLVDGSGQLDDRVYRILELIRKYDMVLATGHISPDECFAVVEAAIRAGIERIIITHPLGSEIVMDRVLTLEETIQLTDMGAYAEHTFVFHLPTEQSADPAVTVENIRKIGPEKCIISTDLGLFNHNPTPVEGFRMYIAMLACKGMTEEDITVMAKTNPAALLGLSD